MKLLDHHPIAARVTSVLLTLVAAGCAAPGAPRGGTDIRVLTAAERRVAAGSAAWFSGTTQVEMLFGAEAPSRVGGANVRFEPGARTHWHTHPLGQTLIVTAGRGWVQRRGQPAQPIAVGDVVVIPPGVEHWHGAAADVAMTHLAVQEALDGQAVDWLEPVTDEQYPK